jgi:hypothetical protein
MGFICKSPEYTQHYRACHKPTRLLQYINNFVTPLSLVLKRQHIDIGLAKQILSFSSEIFKKQMRHMQFVNEKYF